MLAWSIVIGLVYAKNPDSKKKKYQEKEKILNQIYKLFIVYSNKVIKYFVFFLLEMVFLKY